MSNSSLVTYTKISPHKSIGRKYPITKITLHHMAGALSVETCGNVFQTRKASSNYGVDGKGHVGLYVDETDRSWASSNSDNDNRAVTIEIANDRVGGNWHVSDVALNKTIDLCVDICKRNGMPGLTWTGDRSGTLTIHKMFAATACPGPYLESKMKYIAEEVTRRVKNAAAVPVKPVEPKPVVKPEQASKPVKPATAFTVEVLIDDLFIRKSPSFNSGTNGFTGKGVFTITETQNNFGKLKSGAGWIYLDNPNYVKKLSAVEEAPKAKPVKKDFLVKVTTDALRIRQQPTVNSKQTGLITDEGIYTIVDTSSNWGKLKSGTGWICLDYTERV